MSVSAGKLDSLIGTTYTGGSGIDNLVVNSSNSDGSQLTVTDEGTPGLGTTTAETFTVTAVDDTYNSIVVQTYLLGMPFGQQQFFVYAYSSQAIIVSSITQLVNQGFLTVKEYSQFDVGAGILASPPIAANTQLTFTTTGTGTTPSPTPTPKPTPSPDDTVVLAGSTSAITDAQGNSWTIVNGLVDENGAAAGYSANVTELAYVKGTIWQENNQNVWYSWTGTTWSAGTATSPLPATPAQNTFMISDQTTGKSYGTNGAAYSGPVTGLTSEFVTNTSDILNIQAETPNVFIDVAPIAGSPPPSACGIDVSLYNGNNVLDGYANSNFYTGGTGNDSFYEDTRTLTQNSWSTVVNFHAGDAIALWGVTASDFTLDWIGIQGAPGYTGLTGVLVPSVAGQPEVGITLAGFTANDLSSGRVTVGYGQTQAVGSTPGSTYMVIHTT